jgi:AcrR family transcriptional regulator
MATPKKFVRKGKPKGDKRARTRAALIAAAAEVIGERGYERTSLEEIAARAGMSRGAIHGNFRSKEELLFAVVESRWAPVKPELKPGAPLKEQLRIIGRAVAAAAAQRRGAAVGALSFQIHMLTHEKLRAHMAAANAGVYTMIEKDLLRFVKRSDLPMPVGQFVRVLHALGDGLSVCQFLEPENYPDELFVAAFEALASG